MPEQLKILLLEDSAEDAEIVQRLLKKDNPNCECRVVLTREKYLQALENFHPDLILSDNSMPQFNASEALKIMQDLSFHIPFILVTGTVSEEFAATIIKAGATDYVLKDRLARLPTAIDAALKQKKIEKEKLEAEKKVRDSEEKYRTLVEQAADGIFIASVDGKFITVNSSGCNMSQYSEEELMNMTIFDLAVPEDIQRNPFRMEEMKQGKTVIAERVMRRKDGMIIDVETTGKILNDGRLLVFVRDITERKKAEKALRLSEARVRRIFESDMIGFFFWEANGNILEANDHFLRMVGYTKQDIIDGKVNWQKMTPPEYSELDQKALEQIATKGICQPFEKEYIRKDGSRFPILLGATLIDDGFLEKGIAYIMDITERKKAAEELSSNELRFRTLTSNAPVGIFQSDAAGKTIYVNETWLEYTGLSFEEAMGDGWNTALHPDDREPQLKQWEERSKKGLVSSSEFRLIDKKGNIRWVIGKATPLYSNEQISGYIGTLSDITKNKKAVELLAERENHLQTVLNTEPECIKQLNKKGELIDMNPAGLSMIEADNLDQVKGKPISGIVNENYRKAFMELTKNVFNGKPGTLEFEITGLKGTQRWLETHAVPLRDVDGKIISLLGVTRDVTERKKAEEEIKNTAEQLRLLTAHQQNIREEERAHIAREIHDELGQQLTVMKMDVSWLNKRIGATDDTVGKKTQELAKILDETVKTVRRIASELRPSLLDDLGLVAAIEWLLSEFEKRSGVKTKFEETHPLLSLPDSLKIVLFRIVQESLTNVARYAKANNVAVTLEEASNMIIMTIKDDGIGFDKEKIATKKTLGLLGMKERTMMMGGVYEIISAPGKGTIVTVKVPVPDQK